MKKIEKDKLYDMDSQECIEILESLPEAEMDYDLIGILARAYNNDDQEEKAKALMLTVKAEGEKDAVWNYRMGYSCFYLRQYEEALEYLERAKELGCAEWAEELLPSCRIALNPTDDEDETAFDADIIAECDYGGVLQHKESILVCFDIENEKPLAIGEKMNEINEEAYMNGYNWEAFFNFYLPKYAPDIMLGMDSDPEAGMYAACYDLTPENIERAKAFLEIIKSLVENEEELYRILREESEEIEWD